MPPLTRERSLETLRSWWSDRNRPGATINLHAAAKPLMRLMYHRQALSLIKDNATIPLSPMAAEIYLSYLSSKYVSASTKKDILWHLTARVKKEDEALVVHSHIFHHLLELEDRIDISYWLFSLCGRLAQHHDIKGETYGSPLASVRPVDSDRHDFFWENISEFTSPYPYRSPVGANAAVDAHILDDIVKVLKLSTTTDRQHLINACWTCSILAWHKSTAIAVVEAHVPYYAMELLKRPFPPHVHASLCQILAYLLLHESTATAVLSMQPCERLVRVLSISIKDADHVTTRRVFDTLMKMATFSEGAKIVVGSTVLDHVPEGLASRKRVTRFYACELLRTLARHSSTLPVLLNSVPRHALVILLSDKDALIRRQAAEIMRRMNEAVR
ncbi:hypothetical protein C8J57DRAFT_1724123 [Mycena rebaudengoi]|nr:hypothetical protein C8J57DRAFT_1724123 [Mycena rebaudengoi]